MPIFWERQGIAADAVGWLPRTELALSLPVLWAGWTDLRQSLGRGAARRGGYGDTDYGRCRGVVCIQRLGSGDGAGVQVYFDTADMLVALVLGRQACGSRG